MLEKFLNKNVLICFANYAHAQEKLVIGTRGILEAVQRRGTVTAVDDNFIELDNNELVAIKYISTIKAL